MSLLNLEHQPYAVFFGTLVVCLAGVMTVASTDPAQMNEPKGRFEAGGQRRTKVVLATYLKKMLTPLSMCGDAPDRIRARWVWSTNGIENLRQEMRLARSAGIDAFTIDLYPGGRRFQMEGYREMAAAAAKEQFSLVPNICLFGGSGENAADIAALCTEAAEFTNVAIRVDGRPLMVSYAPQVMRPEEWKRTLDNVRKSGFNPCVLFDTSGGLPPSTWREYLEKGGFDGIFHLWQCGDASALRRDILAAESIGEDLKQTNMLIAASATTGYWRPSDQIHISSGETKRYREQWKELLVPRVDIAQVTSWNDFTEYHHIIPSELLGRTRLDLTRYFTQQMRKEKATLPNDPQIYVTYRRSWLLGEKLTFEVLNLPSKAPNRYLHCELRTPEGDLLSDFPPRLIQSGELQAEPFQYATARANDQRCLGLYVYTTSDGIARSAVSEKDRVGSMLLQPLVNRDFTEISCALNDLPQLTAMNVEGEVAQTDGRYILQTLRAKIKSATPLTRVHVRRNGPPVRIDDGYRNTTFLDVWGHKEDEKKGRNVRVRVTLGGRRLVMSSDANDDQSFPLKATLHVDGGAILHVYNDSPNQVSNPVELNKISDSDVEITTRGRLQMHPIAVVLLIAGGKETRVQVSWNGRDDAWKIGELNANIPSEKEMEDNGKGLTRRVAAVLMDGPCEPEAFDGREYNVKAIKYSRRFPWLQSQSPNDCYFLRVYGQNGWKDSFPVWGQKSLHEPVEIQGFDQVNSNTFPVKISGNEVLLGSYSFEETGGSLVVDDSAYLFHGRLGGGSLGLTEESLKARPKRIDGIKGHGLEFDGTDDYLLLPAALVPVGAFSVEFWVKPSGIGKLQAVFTTHRFNKDHGSIDLYLQPDGRISANLHRAPHGFEWDSIQSPNPLEVSRWHQVVCTYDLKQWRLYIDGQLVVFREIGPRIGSIGVPLIGMEALKGVADFGNFFAGTLDELRVWGRPLQASEIASNYKTMVAERRL